MENEVPIPEQANYTVVARRYRPKTFGELIGQDHIAQALGKAIATGRVGHAYLFTGARGVGKTSTARIFAKVLNVPEGTEAELASEISRAIDAGEDMDVIEIDGASNRGIEEIRQLRANVNVRPSRADYKIYIIDEVHMLTHQAFNALLKTLEEPPPHVKFIFCTTDPDKIPITVLSRCQRFDFAPVKYEAIRLRLKEICEAEGFTASDEALGLLARRAAGSMRDSQSLLEQVMSFSADQITVQQVHELLGTADEGRLLALAGSMRDADALKAIDLIDEATRAGADPGQLAEQLLGYLRDIMAVGLGGPPELLKLANPVGHESLKELAGSWGVQTILSAIQILDESLVRMRTSVSATTLLEVAVVQICQLEKLASIPALLDAVMQGPSRGSRQTAGPATEKKNASVTGPGAPLQVAQPPSSPAASPDPALPPAANPSASVSSSAISSEGLRADTSQAVTPADRQPSPAPPPASDKSANQKSVPEKVESSPAVSQSAESQRATSSRASPDALSDWQRAVAKIDGMLADFAGMAEAVEPAGSDQWNIIFPPGANKPREVCSQPERKAELQAALQSAIGRIVQLNFSVKPGEAPQPVATAAKSTVRAQKMREVAEDPYVKKVCEVLDGEILRVDPPKAIAIPGAKALGKNANI